MSREIRQLETAPRTPCAVGLVRAGVRGRLFGDKTSFCACIMRRYFHPQLGLPRSILMKTQRTTSSAPQIQQWFIRNLAIVLLLLPPVANAQGLTGTLIGTVRDEQGAAIPG